MTIHKQNNSTNKPRRGITKAEGYVIGIYTPEYDLEEMIIAFGVKAVSVMILERYEALKGGKRYNSRDKMARKMRDRVSSHMNIDAELAE